MLARLASILLLVAALVQALCGNCRATHAMAHSAHATHSHTAACSGHSHATPPTPVKTCPHDRSNQHSADAAAASVESTQHCDLCDGHGPDGPAHTHVCRAESTLARARVTLELPPAVPLLFVASADAFSDASAADHLAHLRSLRCATGPPPAVRTTRLLI